MHYLNNIVLESLTDTVRYCKSGSKYAFKIAAKPLQIEMVTISGQWSVSTRDINLNALYKYTFYFYLLISLHYWQPIRTRHSLITGAV